VISVEAKKALIRDAEQLANALSRFRTPDNAEPVDPSRLSEVQRFLAQTRSKKRLLTFLELLPNSFHAKISRSAHPQLQEVSRRVRPLVTAQRSVDELLYLLGLARRLLQISESVGMDAERPRTGARRGGGPRGGGDRAGRGRR